MAEVVEVAEVVEANAVSAVSQSVVKPAELCGQAILVPKLEAQHSVEESLATTEPDLRGLCPNRYN